MSGAKKKKRRKERKKKERNTFKCLFKVKYVNESFISFLFKVLKAILMMFLHY